MIVDILGILLAIALLFVGIRSIVTKTPISMEDSPRAQESEESAAKLARNAGIVEIAIGIISAALVFLKSQGVLAENLVLVLLVIILFELHSTRWLVLYMMKPKK